MSGRRRGRRVHESNGFLACLIGWLGRPVIRRLSELAAESLRQPGSWRCLEIVYRNEPRTLLDRFFLRSRSARGARNRLEVLQEEILRCVEQRSPSRSPVAVVSFGSGPGHEILGCIPKLAGSVTVEATCLDLDRSALDHGRVLAAREGLDGCVTYVHGNILRLDAGIGRHDVGVLSGLLDYFDFETAISVLRTVGGRLRPGGTLLVANMRKHYLAATMSVLGNWHLVYREPEELEEILRKSGYEEIKVWLEPENIFCIARATWPGRSAQ